MKEEEAKGITLDSYALSKGKMLRVTAARYMRWPLAIISLGFLALIVLGCVLSWKWFVMALMYLLILTPLLMFFLYIRYCINLEMAMNTSEHILTVEPDRIVCRWRPSLLPSERKLHSDDEPTTPDWRTDEFAKERVKGLRIGVEALSIWLDNGGKGAAFFYVPYSSIPEGEADRLVEMISHN